VNGSKARVRRRTLELHRLIGETADAVGVWPCANAVLFVDRDPHVFPARVVRDAVLQPVDRVM